MIEFVEVNTQDVASLESRGERKTITQIAGIRDGGEEILPAWYDPENYLHTWLRTNVNKAVFALMADPSDVKYS